MNTAVDVISLFTPARRFATQAALPEVTALYYAIIWLATPALMLRLLADFRRHSRSGRLGKHRSELGLREWFVYLFAIVFFSMGFAILWMFYQGQDTRFFDVGTSRVQLAVFGPFMTVSGCALLFMVFLILKQLIRGRAF